MSKRENLLPVTESQLEALEMATASYQAQLTKGATGRQAAEYLFNRGIDQGLAHTSRLGVVTEPLPEHSMMRGRLAIPYLDKDGQPLSLRFRCIQHKKCEGHPKYRSMEGEPPRTYNVGAIHRAKDELHVTEGEMDCLILQKVGLSAIGIPGAAMWASHHRRMLAGFSKVYVWQEPGEGGGRFASAVTRSIRHARIVRLDAGDIGETFLAQGGEHLLSLMRGEK